MLILKQCLSLRISILYCFLSGCQWFSSIKNRFSTILSNPRIMRNVITGIYEFLSPIASPRRILNLNSRRHITIRWHLLINGCIIWLLWATQLTLLRIGHFLCLRSWTDQEMLRWAILEIWEEVFVGEEDTLGLLVLHLVHVGFDVVGAVHYFWF